MKRDRETWLVKVELPADVGHRGGRFMARLLKHLLRAWGVRCTAVLDPDSPAQAHRIAQDAPETKEG